MCREGIDGRGSGSSSSSIVAVEQPFFGTEVGGALDREFGVGRDVGGCIGSGVDFGLGGGVGIGVDFGVS